MSKKSEVSEYQVFRTPKPVRIDGRLDDPAWKEAPVIELLESSTGKPPRYPTRARMLYDDRCLYVGFHCVDPDIWGTFHRHDDPIYEEEVVEIFLDPLGNLCAYYELEVSPLNTGFDALILNDAVITGTPGRGGKFQGFSGWNPSDFRHAVYLEGKLNAHDGKSKFWEAILAVPFNEMFLGGNAPPKPGDIWRGNLYRIDSEGGRLEESAFSPTFSEDFHVPGRFGKFIFR